MHRGVLFGMGEGPGSVVSRATTCGLAVSSRKSPAKICGLFGSSQFQPDTGLPVTGSTRTRVAVAFIGFGYGGGPGGTFDAFGFGVLIRTAIFRTWLFRVTSPRGAIGSGCSMYCSALTCSGLLGS